MTYPITREIRNGLCLASLVFFVVSAGCAQSTGKVNIVENPNRIIGTEGKFPLCWQ